MAEDRLEPLPVFRVSSAELGARTAFGAYEEALHDVFGIRPEDSDLTGFRLDIAVTHLGVVLLSDATSSAQRFERSRRLVATGGLDHVLVQLYTKGGYAGVSEGSDIRVRGGDICFLDMTRSIETSAADFRNITLCVPRALLATYVPDVDALHGLVMARHEPVTRLLAAHMQALSLHAAKLSPIEGESAGRATVSLVGELAGRSVAGRGSHAVPLTTFRQVLRYIDRQIADPALGPAQLIERFGLSRATLYRMFEPHGGVAEVIRTRRLNGAAVELASAGAGGRRISEVARAWGFVSSSSFTRAFSARFGVPPTAARRHAAALWATAGGFEGDAGYGAELACWLRMLRA